MWVKLGKNLIGNLETGKTYRFDLQEKCIDVNTPIVKAHYDGQDDRSDEHIWRISDHEYVNHSFQFETEELCTTAWVQLVRLVSANNTRYIHELVTEVRGV